MRSCGGKHCVKLLRYPLDKNGELDLIALEKEIADPKYKDRKKIGSFSAASKCNRYQDTGF